MRKQRKLPLSDVDELDALWESLPGSCRRELVILIAPLMARAAKAFVLSLPKEPSDDGTDS